MVALPLLVAALTAAPARAAATPPQAWAGEASGPAFRAAQAVADGVYEFASGAVLRPILPDALAARVASAPDEDSAPVFAARLRARQERAIEAGLASRPAGDAATPAAVADWSRGLLEAQRDAALDAFAMTLADRYRLQRLGRATGDYAKDSAHWSSPDFLAPGFVLGGAYAYLAGVRADFTARGLKFRLDLAPGERLRSAAEGGGAGRLARVAVSRRGSPLSAYAEWSARASERVGATWTRRF